MPSAGKNFQDLYRLSGREMKSRAQAAIVISGAAMFLSWPVFFYQLKNLAGRSASSLPGDYQLLKAALGQSILLLAAALLSSLVGLLYAKRLSLPGLGKPSDLKLWLPLALGLGLFFSPVSYFIFDHRVMARAPEIFPEPWPWALAWMCGTALSQEVVARLGLLTIGVYFLRWFGFSGHPWPAILAVCFFTLMSSLIFSHRYGLGGRLEPMLLYLSLASAFVFQWLYSEVYIRKGFLAAVALHLGLNLKLVVYAVIRTGWHP